MLKDQPALNGNEIKDPEQDFDPNTNQPNVTFDFTDNGRQAFADVTRRIAERGAPERPARRRRNSPGRRPYSGHFAVVLDSEVKSRPIINFVENPTGIDGRTGAQISGIGDVQTAQDLARFLQIGALPVDLELISPDRRSRRRWGSRRSTRACRRGSSG